MAELEAKLRSSKVKLTREEENVLRKCKEKAIRDFMIGALVTSGITWTVTPRLGLGYRLNATGAAAVVSGNWRFDRALNSCLDTVLSLDGSRLQKELATILLTKYSHNPWRMQLVNKHYYLEKVYDESNLEVPQSRWRRRNLSGDAWSYHRANVREGVGMSEKVRGATNPIFSGSHMEDILVDPLEFIFGHPKRTEDANLDTQDLPQRRPSRRHKRADRRHNISPASMTTNSKNAE